MQFNSLDYLLFLVAAVGGLWVLARLESLVPRVAVALRRAPRFALLFALSCLFYMTWQPLYIVLLLGTAGLDFIAGMLIASTETPWKRRVFLGVSLVANLGLLAVFKYFNFAASAVTDALNVFGLGLEAPVLGLVLPVGISFYTFQSMSYTIDVYRRVIEPTFNPLEYGVFATFFPQLVAGPIVRATEFLPQLQAEPALQRGRVGRGAFLIATGLAKKILVADFLSLNLVDRVFENPQLYTATEVVIALYGFTMQIYCDFSGYTDVARGSAMLMGIELPENFDRPYQSTSPAEFWRRWHMTLSRWLRDYLYFPLGGSKVGPVRAYVNLGLTMFLIGIWHGAAWTFFFYALLQAAAMVLHRFFYRVSGRTADMVDPLWVRALKILACLQFVVFSRILFRANDIDNATHVVERLFSGTWSVAQVSLSVWIVLLGSFALHYTPRSLYAGTAELFERSPAIVQGALLVLFGYLLAILSTGQVVPYIYFQF
jgi:D-alanyl-lipoteichoic acid acyltransferase DltB (MBOAT superfamily)